MMRGNPCTIPKQFQVHGNMTLVAFLCIFHGHRGTSPVFSSDCKDLRLEQPQRKLVPCNTTPRHNSARPYDYVRVTRRLCLRTLPRNVIFCPRLSLFHLSFAHLPLSPVLKKFTSSLLLVCPSRSQKLVTSITKGVRRAST